MLKSLFWIGATGIALVAGIALHHGDDIERAGREISVQVGQFEDVGEHLEREFEEAEAAVEDGADREASYEDALASALVSSGIFNLENIDDIESGDLDRRLEIDRGVRVELGSVIEQAREKLEEAREAGELPETTGNISGRDIDEVIELLEGMQALERGTTIEIQ